LSADRQRIDRWLWHARVVRSRVDAASLAEAGHVRVNGQRIDASSRPVRLGDVVTVALDRRVRVMKVVGIAERRGASEAAKLLYEDLAAPAERGPGAGRPAEQNRRVVDRLQGREGE
jgi:ribosome-associated heat shock protein Hsp15